MALPYFPHPGEILICDFDDSAPGAEMIKRRPCVVVSRHETHNRRLCTVVPLSTTAPPLPVRAWHHPMPHLKITGWVAKGDVWAKCDMLATVSFERLNKPYIKTRHGRSYVTLKLANDDLVSVMTGIRAYLGL